MGHGIANWASPSHTHGHGRVPRAAAPSLSPALQSAPPRPLPHDPPRVCTWPTPCSPSPKGTSRCPQRLRSPNVPRRPFSCTPPFWDPGRSSPRPGWRLSGSIPKACEAFRKPLVSAVLTAHGPPPSNVFYFWDVLHLIIIYFIHCQIHLANVFSTYVHK